MSAPPLGEALAGFLQHLRVERRLAARTLAMYADALGWLQQFAADEGIALATAQTHHVRGWTARLRERGLGPRSIAIALAAWRGLYRHWGRERLVTHNPVDGIRPPKAPKPLPKALAVDQAVALAQQVPTSDNPALRARDHCIVELLYGCGLRVGELVGLDLSAGPLAAGWIDSADATAHVLGKGAKRRSVPVGGPALLALAAWVHRCAMRAFDATAALRPLSTPGQGLRRRPSARQAQARGLIARGDNRVDEDDPTARRQGALAAAPPPLGFRGQRGPRRCRRR